MHLTNYAINKENPNFIFNNDATKMDVGHKRSIKSVFGKLEEEGFNIKKLWQEMNTLFIKTFCTVQPILSQHYRSCQPDNFANNMCFEILGFDIFLNHKL
jgi:tubulin polyglutamylase TTLL6/13